jgi:hypothetical protein
VTEGPLACTRRLQLQQLRDALRGRPSHGAVVLVFTEVLPVFQRRPLGSPAEDLGRLVNRRGARG